MVVDCERLGRLEGAITGLQKQVYHLNNESGTLRRLLAAAGLLPDEKQFEYELHRQRFMEAEKRHPMGPMASVEVLGTIPAVGPMLSTCIGYQTTSFLAASSKALTDMRQFMPFRPMICVFGGRDSERETVETCEIYDPKTEVWRDIPQVRPMRSYAAAAVALGQVYILGGLEDQDGSTSAERFDPKEQTWTTLPPMGTKRHSGCAASMHGDVFVLGGRNSDNNVDPLSTCERFDLETSSWREAPGMKTCRYGCAAAAAEGFIYVAGGSERYAPGSALATAECFNPNTSSWTMLPPMRSRRLGASAAGIFGKLHVLGGCGDPRSGMTMECYDPSEGTWSSLPPMTIKRSFASVAAVGGKLYVLGGQEWNGANNKIGGTGECFDTKTGERGAWSTIPQMGTCRFAAAGAAVLLV